MRIPICPLSPVETQPDSSIPKATEPQRINISSSPFVVESTQNSPSMHLRFTDREKLAFRNDKKIATEY